MQTQLQPSPMLHAIDLMRVNVDELDLPDLRAHAVEVLGTIAALNEYINGPLHKSLNALLNALQLSRKLCLHMARVRDLIQAHQSANAMAQATIAANTPSVPQRVPTMGRRSRVIRPLKSADNATSRPIQILSNDPQGRGAKAVWGGEAKEWGAQPQSGEASLQAKR